MLKNKDMHVSPKKIIFFLVPIENELEGELTNLRGRYFFFAFYMLFLKNLSFCVQSVKMTRRLLVLLILVK